MIFVVLIPLWLLGLVVILRDLDRERTAREKAARKVQVRPLTQDEEAARDLYRKRDRDRVHALRATRYADQQEWEMRRNEADHIKHVRDLRKLYAERTGRTPEPSEDCGELPHA